MESKTLHLTIIICASMIPAILIKHSELHGEILIEREKLNNTKFANQSILIYNRIPKVGFN